LENSNILLIKENKENRIKLKQQDEMFGKMSKVTAEKCKMEEYFNKEMAKTKAQATRKLNLQNKYLNQYTELLAR